MNNKDQYKQWIKLVESSMTLEPVKNLPPPADECGCREWDCETCFPQDDVTVVQPVSIAQPDPESEALAKQYDDDIFFQNSGTERESINKVLGAILEGKDIQQYGIPVKEVASDDPDKKKYAPSTFTGDVIHAGKHLVAVIENQTDDKVYVRIIESTRFPLTASEHADRAKSVQAKMNIDPANIKSINIQGVDHQVIENTKRYMAFSKNYEVAKVDFYRPKAENAKSKQAELAQ